MFRAVMRSVVAATALVSAAPHAGAAELPPTITILEGEVQIYRAAARLVGAEGVRLANGDIVETGATTFAQIELPDQSVLQLGPGARAMFGMGGARAIYVMTGWGKMSGLNRDPKAGSSAYTIRAPLFEIGANQAVVVFKASPGEVAMFVERGDARIAERQGTSASVAVALKANDFYRRKSGTRGAVNAGPPQPFLAEMPRFFRDSLPSRLDRYRDKEIRPREGPPFAYADVEVWLKAEPNVRRLFVPRWRGKAASDSAFRSALVANLASHFEWDPILFPEKYLPKDPPQTQTTGTPAGSTAPLPGR